MADRAKHEIWAFQRTLTARLLAWSALSVIAGMALQMGDAFQRGFGAQAVGWGLIDALIAGIGRRGATRKEPTAMPAAAAHEARRLRRLLWFNAGLDVLYVLGGLRLAQTKGRDNEHWRGHGWGIVVQGAFLLLFDVWHGLKTPGPFDEPAPPTENRK